MSGKLAMQADRTICLRLSMWDMPNDQHPSRVVEPLRARLQEEFPGVRIQTVAQSMGDQWWIFIEVASREQADILRSRVWAPPLSRHQYEETQAELDHWTTFGGAHLS